MTRSTPLPSTTPPAHPTRALAREVVAEVYRRPLLELVFQAAAVHREHHDPSQVQCAALLSVKTGGCPEDCAYCPQSAHHSTELEREGLFEVDEVLQRAKTAQQNGADRFCMGAAWREVRDGDELDRVVDMVKGVKELGLETCLTLGMLQPHQAQRLKQAGLDFYNHNLDSSREFYSEIISTRGYDDRLKTLGAVRQAGLAVCCGGILGMGEAEDDRIGLLWELARQDPAPESVPLNTLVAVEGTPLEQQQPVEWDVLVRTVAAARILMPRSWVRLSAGRRELSEEAQAFCFLAGANSIFLGDRLLTTPNPEPGDDEGLLGKLGLRQLARSGERT